MKRFAVILLTLSLGFVACAHDHALSRGDIAAMQTDSPAISPWSGPVPNEEIEEARPPVRSVADVK
ncbi:MAG: hypothetical protein ACJ79H_05225 [Myxococcales bacterium]